MLSLTTAIPQIPTKRRWSNADLAMKALHISVPPVVEKLATNIRMWHASDPL